MDTECVQIGNKMDAECVQIGDTDKNRLDKNRLDKKGDSKGDVISKALLKTWQSNLDAEEANKEIRQ